MKQVQLRIGDLAVALALATRPRAQLKVLVDACARSLGEVHNAERRLRAARLLQPESRTVALEPLIRFIRYGVPHAYPPTIGPTTRGFATARLTDASSPDHWQTEPAEAEFVWPDATGPTRGQAFAPPYPAATRLVSLNPELRALLSLMDLVRVGGAREQAAAVEELERRLSASRT